VGVELAEALDGDGDEFAGERRGVCQPQGLAGGLGADFLDHRLAESQQLDRFTFQQLPQA